MLAAKQHHADPRSLSSGGLPKGVHVKPKARVAKRSEGEVVAPPVGCRVGAVEVSLAQVDPAFKATLVQIPGCVGRGLGDRRQMCPRTSICRSAKASCLFLLGLLAQGEELSQRSLKRMSNEQQQWSFPPQTCFNYRYWR